jgi:hypothetical protein
MFPTSATRFTQLWLCCVLALLMSACHTGNHYKKNASHTTVPDESIEQGEKLAAQFCQSCHLLPHPSLLSATTWANGVLPQMGPRLGIFEHLYQRYPNNLGDPHIDKSFYPAQPLLSAAQWQNIIDYYTALSPDSLPHQQRAQPIENNSGLFSVSTPAFKNSPPTTCLIKIDTATHQLFSSDIVQQSFYRFNAALQLTDSIRTGGAIVDLTWNKQDIIACNIGAFAPNNAKAGYVQQLHTNARGRLQADTGALFSELMRPVGLAAGDLNNDSRPDYVVNEFGYLLGALSWEENKGDHFERHVLYGVPGAIKAYVQDVNHDGLQDIWVLFAQGEEGIFLFTNQGKGQFTREEVLRFPPSYGSTYFELADFNKDGFPDIVYTCGDNGDYSTILKPYHGVYVYLNDGKNHFKQHSFFPINGCYKAIARDFDNDGDLDIATIAFFADYATQPEEGFVYLQNQGNNRFKPFTTPQAQQGRWITMDAGDLDGDGKPELVLGNCSMGPSFIKTHPDWQKGPVLMVLKITGK